MSSLGISPCGPLDVEIEAPPSKSLTLRGLAAAALAAGASALRRPLFSDDTWLMARALNELGIETSRRGTSVVLEGCGGAIPSSGARLDLGDAGTPLRLLTAICCLGRGRFVLDGSARMRERPIADLIDALASLGVLITSVRGNGCPPVEVLAGGLPGGSVRLRGGVSSQYLSALLMAGPYGASDLDVTIEGELVSRPYADLTLEVMTAFGAATRRDGYRAFHVDAGVLYQPRVYPIEGDASSASYLFAAAAIAGGSVRVTGIPRTSRQGDLRFLDLLEAMGCQVSRQEALIEVRAGGGDLQGIEADLVDMPDVAPTLAAVALFAAGPTSLRGIGHLRVKESDRIEGIAACARALGAGAETGPDWLTVRPPPAGRAALRGAAIDPRGDHRLAMAFALPGLAIPGVRILDPACVTKSYPGYFEQLAAMTET